MEQTNKLLFLLILIWGELPFHFFSRLPPFPFDNTWLCSFFFYSQTFRPLIPIFYYSFTVIPMAACALIFYIRHSVPEPPPPVQRRPSFCFTLYVQLRTSFYFRIVFFIFCAALIILIVSLIRLIVTFSS